LSAVALVTGCPLIQQKSCNRVKNRGVTSLCPFLISYGRKSLGNVIKKTILEPITANQLERNTQPGVDELITMNRAIIKLKYG
jgi:hypothetical protein